ncbi:MAG: T9SS type A sorting domain-containing protein [Saprospiraceae bacterium]|nr:T9SS type A sorting domain-containing protein [Saprospiraceae bacterium]
MKRSTIILLLLLPLSSLVEAQIQLTQIDKQVSYLKYDLNGIEHIEGEDYLIEANASSLRVSKLGQPTEILYEVSDYPIDDEINVFYGRFETRSGFYVKDGFLYEVFENQIRKRHLESGDIVEIYPFLTGTMPYIFDMEVIDNLIHIKGASLFPYSIYNITNQLFTPLQFQYDRTFRDQHTYYSDLNGLGIVKFDALTGDEEHLFQNEPVLSVGPESNMNQQKGFVFGNIFTTRFINNDTTFQLTCPIQLNHDKANIIESENYHFVFTQFEDGSSFEVVDKNDCSILFSEIFSDGFDGGLKLFDTPLAPENYIFFASGYGGFGSTEIHLFDTKNLSLHTVSMYDVGLINPNSFFYSNSDLYFIGRDPGEPEPAYFVYSVNLESKSFSAQHTGFDGFIRPYCFSKSNLDETYIAFLNSSQRLEVANFKSGAEVDNIYLTNDLRNAGLTSPQYLAVKDQQMALGFLNKLYWIDHNSSEPVKEIFEADEFSKMVIRNQGVEGLVNANDTSYYFRYNFVSQTIDTIVLDKKVKVESLSKSTSNYIFGAFSATEKLYFDLDSKSFVSIDVPGLVIWTLQSKENMLLFSESTSGPMLTSFIDGEFKNIPLELDKAPKIFIKGNGEFFVVESLENQISRISVIKTDGTIGARTTISGRLWNYYPNGMERGALSGLVFYDASNSRLKMLLHRFDNLNLFSIPVDDAFVPLVWYKSGDNIIIKIDESEQEGIYLFTLGHIPVKLDIKGTDFHNYDLLFATHRENSIHLLVKSFADGFEMVQYDKKKYEFTKSSVESFGIYTEQYATHSSLRVSDHKHLLSFYHQPRWDEYENSEFFEFDTDNLTFTPASDINQSPENSNPRTIFETETTGYFIAKSPSDNSYQLFYIDKETITFTEDEDRKDSNLTIYPNPTHNYISLDRDVDLISIRNMDGRLLMSQANYKKGTSIGLRHFESGVYILESTNHNKNTSQMFIKQ